jgi:hypothetical protein
MRKSLLLIWASATVFSCNIFAMQALIHMIDKNYISPETYVTNNKASELCEEIMLLNTEKDGCRFFQPDDRILGKIYQAFEREQKLLSVCEQAICTENSDTHLERIKTAHKAFISPNYESITKGFLAARLRHNEQMVEKLTKVPPLKSSSTQLSTLGTKQLITANDHLSPQALEEEILKSNATYIQKTANYIRKTMIDPVGYLTDQKSATVADTVLLFNPELPNSIDFNQSFELHRALVHNAFERQNRLRLLVYYYVQNNDYNNMHILCEKTHKGYQSPLTGIVIRAYLKYAETKTKIENVRSISSLQSSSSTPENSFLNVLDGPCNCQAKQTLKECKQCLIDGYIQLSIAASSIKTPSPQQKTDSNNTTDNNSSN